MEQNKINNAIEFLSLCQKIAQNTYLDKSVVYSLLENYKIKESDIQSNEKISPLSYYNNWKISLTKHNLDVYSWGNYWTGFDNGKRMNSFIKIYLSLDREHLFEGVRQLFSYIESQNIVHTSKSTSHIRTDNIIIRLNPNDYNSLKKICDYIENNSYLKEGMNKVNPFLPTIGSVGVMYDDGRSYNSELAGLISVYINKNIHKNNIDFSDFTRFVREMKKNDFIFLETFNQAFFENSKYKDIIRKQELIKEDKINIPGMSSKEIFELAVITAFEKYGKSQARFAISRALQGDYSSFSRMGEDSWGNKIELRSYLENNISLDMIKTYILENNTFNEKVTYEDIIKKYVDSVIYRYKGKILEEALFATAMNHNDEKEHIEIRIREYANRGDEKLFSRYNSDILPNYNYRKSVSDNIAPAMTYDIVDSILFSKGIEYEFLTAEQKVVSCSDVIINILYKKYA